MSLCLPEQVVLDSSSSFPQSLSPSHSQRRGMQRLFLHLNLSAEQVCWSGEGEKKGALKGEGETGIQERVDIPAGLDGVLFCLEGKPVCTFDHRQKDRRRDRQRAFPEPQKSCTRIYTGIHTHKLSPTQFKISHFILAPLQIQDTI